MRRNPRRILKVDDVDVEKLIEIFLDEPWHYECRILPEYMPPHPQESTRPTVQVHFRPDVEHNPCLRYSHGPKQGFFWDVYGDDFQSVELAIVALAQAPAPVDVGPVVFKLRINDKELDDE